MQRNILLALIRVSLAVFVMQGAWSQNHTHHSTLTSKHPPQAPKRKGSDEIEQLILQRDKLVKEGKNREALPIAERVVQLLRRRIAVSAPLGGSIAVLADIPATLKKYQESDSNFAEALLVYRNANMTDTLDVARVWHLWGWSRSSRALLGEARECNLKALSIRERLAPGSLLFAQSLQNLGSVASRQGQLDAAWNYHSRALSIREHLAPGSLDFAGSLMGVGIVVWKRGKPEDAQRYFERAISIQQRLAPESLDLADSFNNLGNATSDRGLLDDAQRHYEHALSIYERIAPDSIGLASTLNNLGVLESDRGKFDASQQYYSRALAIYEKIVPNSLDVANCLSDLGDLASTRQQLEHSQRYYTRALALYERLAPDSLDLANCLNSLGELASNRQQLEDSQGYFTRALGLYERLAPDSLNLATCLNNLGDLASNRHQLEEAQGYYTRALSIRERLVPDSLDLARSLDDLGVLLQDRGLLDDAQRYLTRSLAIRERLAPDSQDVAISLNILGRVASLRNQLVDEKGYYDRALTILRRLAPDSDDLARTLSGLGSVAWNRRQLEAAALCHSLALSIQVRLAPNSLAVASCLSNLGNVAWQRGQLDTAYRYNTRALSIRERLAPNSLDVAYCLTGLGNVEFARGKLEEAQRYHSQAMALYERLAPESLHIAVGLTNLGGVVYERGQLQDASGYFNRALAIRERLMPDSLDVADILNNLGNVAKAYHQAEEAQRFYSRALAMKERLVPDSLSVAMSLINLGNVASDRGLFDEAEHFYLRANSICERLAPDSLDMAMSLNNLGTVAWLRGQYDHARRYYGLALAIRERLGPDSLDGSDTLNNLCDVARRQGNLRQLSAYSSRDFDLIESLLVRESITQGGMTGAIGLEAAKCLERIGLLAEPDKEYSWVLALRAAGLTLQSRAMSAARLASEDRGVSSATQDVQLRVKAESDWVTQPRPQGMKPKEWEEKLFDLRRQRQAAELTLSLQLKEKDPRVSGDLTVKLTDVQGAIRKEHVLVEFLKVKTWNEKASENGPDAYAAFIVRPIGPVQYVQLEASDKVDTEVAEFMALVDIGNPTTDEEKQRTALGKALYKELIAPLGKLPPDLLFAPDGSLHSLAFDALQDGRGRYLIETSSISLVGSGRDLVLKQPTIPASEPVVMGVGSFDANMESHERLAKAFASNFSGANSVDRGGGSSSRWSRLDGAEYEATNVGTQLGVHPILGEEAIQERFLATKNPRVLHLATHGFFFPPSHEKPKEDRLQGMSMSNRIGYADNPMLRSGIVLAGANDEEKLRAAHLLPGWVTALDISQMDLRGTELVVISACNTGRGEVKLSEGVFGLQRAFKFAGAQSLVMSLIDVPDAATQKLMTEFYGMWKPGAPAGAKQQALRASKLHLLKDPKMRSPKNWAGFVLLGDR